MTPFTLFDTFSPFFPFHNRIFPTPWTYLFFFWLHFFLTALFAYIRIKITKLLSHSLTRCPSDFSQERYINQRIYGKCYQSIHTREDSEPWWLILYFPVGITYIVKILNIWRKASRLSSVIPFYNINCLPYHLQQCQYQKIYGAAQNTKAAVPFYLNLGVSVDIPCCLVGCFSLIICQFCMFQNACRPWNWCWRWENMARGRTVLKGSALLLTHWSFTTSLFRFYLQWYALAVPSQLTHYAFLVHLSLSEYRLAGTWKFKQTFVLKSTLLSSAFTSEFFIVTKNNSRDRTFY